MPLTGFQPLLQGTLISASSLHLIMNAPEVHSGCVLAYFRIFVVLLPEHDLKMPGFRVVGLGF